jgi:hypothetical protein
MWFVTCYFVAGGSCKVTGGSGKVCSLTPPSFQNYHHIPITTSSIFSQLKFPIGMIASTTLSRLSILDRVNLNPFFCCVMMRGGVPQNNTQARMSRGWEEGGDVELFYVYDFCRKITSPGKGF